VDLLCIYRYRFPSGRDNPLTSVPPPSHPPAFCNGALLPAYCEKTAFSTLEVATRRGLKLITVTTIGTARRGRTPADAPDTSCVCVYLPGVFSYVISRRNDDNFGEIAGIMKASRDLALLTRSMIHTNHKYYKRSVIFVTVLHSSL